MPEWSNRLKLREESLSGVLIFLQTTRFSGGWTNLYMSMYSFRSESESAGENSLSNTVANDGSSFGPFGITASTAQSQLSL